MERHPDATFFGPYSRPGRLAKQWTLTNGSMASIYVPRARFGWALP